MPTNSPAINGAQSSLALHPSISATGTKGFLMWMKSDPTMRKVYSAITPQLISLLNVAPAGALGSLGCCLTACYYDPCYTCPSCYDPDLQDSITASAPSDSVSSSSLTGSLAALLGVGESAALTASQISQSNAVVNAQLAQAAAGKSPLSLSIPLGASGSTTLSGTTLLLIGGGLLAVLVLSGRSKSA